MLLRLFVMSLLLVMRFVFVGMKCRLSELFFGVL